MSFPDEIDRRDFLGLGAGAWGLILTGVPFLPKFDPEDCTVTPETVIGPFYPHRDRADEDVDLTRVKGRSGRAEGEVIHVRGQVLDEACEPVEGAVVEIWQADTNGRYHHEDDNLDRPIDENFQGWAESRTGPEGQYGFTTIKPAPYPIAPNSSTYRTRHIHFRVSHGDHYELITQMYFEGEPLNKSDRPFQQLTQAERDQLVVAPVTGGGPDGDLYPFDLQLSALKTDLIDPELWNRYVGTYQLERGDETLTVRISRDGPRLFAHVWGDTIELRPLSQTRFAFDPIGEAIIFHPDEDSGGTATMVLNGGEELAGPKVADSAN